MPKAIVTGAFMTPEGTQLIDDHGEAHPAPRIVRPSADGGRPVVVEIESWAFQRQHGLGNVEAYDAWKLMQEAEAAAGRAMLDARAAADLAREEALAGVERLSLQEDVDRLDDMDKQALIDLAIARRLKVNQRRSEENVRKDVRAELMAKLDSL